MNVTVTLEKAAVKARIEAAIEKAQFVITNEFIKDANYYCRMDTGELIRSSIRASQPEKGRAIWDTPYAKKVYYTGRPSKDTNPNASLLWCEKAKKQHKDKYTRIGQKIAKELI